MRRNAAAPAAPTARTVPTFLGVPGADYDGARGATPAVTAKRGGAPVLRVDAQGYAVAIEPGAGNVNDDQVDLRGVDQRRMYARKNAVLRAAGAYPGIGTQLVNDNGVDQ